MAEGAPSALDMKPNLQMEIEEVTKRILISELKISSAILQTISLMTPLFGRGIGLDSSETVAGTE